MAGLPPPDLDAVFAPGEGAPVEDMPPAEDEAMASDIGNEEALNAAIDEAFSTDDPDLRREAFKNAMRLCMPDAY